MTFYDADGGEREDRIIIGYDFTDHSVAGINLACNGHTPRSSSTWEPTRSKSNSSPAPSPRSAT